MRPLAGQRSPLIDLHSFAGLTQQDRCQSHHSRPSPIFGWLGARLECCFSLFGGLGEQIEGVIYGQEVGGDNANFLLFSCRGQDTFAEERDGGGACQKGLPLLLEFWAGVLAPLLSGSSWGPKCYSAPLRLSFPL